MPVDRDLEPPAEGRVIPNGDAGPVGVPAVGRLAFGVAGQRAERGDATFDHIPRVGVVLQPELVGVIVATAGPAPGRVRLG